ncbi:hypothetical protein [Streptomyces altiplanensis]
MITSVQARTCLSSVTSRSSTSGLTWDGLFDKAGLSVAAHYDWPDDSSGLFMAGLVMVAVGSLVVTAAVSAVIAAVTRNGRRRDAGQSGD